MNVVTIPKTLMKNDDLIVMPRREYEKKDTEFYEKLDKDLAESIKEVEAGKFCGPFDNAGDLMRSLRAK